MHKILRAGLAMGALLLLALAAGANNGWPWF